MASKLRLLVAIILALLCPLAPGCRKKPVPPPPGGGASHPERVIPVDPKVLPEVLSGRELPNSYRMTMEENGRSYTSSVLFYKGQAAVVKMTSPRGWSLYRPDQGASYSYDAERGVVMRVMNAEQPSYTVPIVGRDTLDGRECWIAETSRPANIDVLYMCTPPPPMVGSRMLRPLLESRRERLPHESLGLKTRMWIDKRTGLLMRLQEGSVDARFHYDLGDLSPSEFRLPPGSKVGGDSLTGGDPLWNPQDRPSLEESPGAAGAGNQVPARPPAPGGLIPPPPKTLPTPRG